MDLTRIAASLADAKVAAPKLHELKKSTDALESYMFKTLLGVVQKSGGLFGKDVPGGSIYQDMFQQQIADAMASRGALGIGKNLFDHIAPVAVNNATAARLQAAVQQRAQKGGQN